jgi:hypothetical protein
MGERKYMLANEPNSVTPKAMDLESKGKKQLSPTSIAFLLNDISLDSNANKNPGPLNTAPITGPNTIESSSCEQWSPSTSRSYIDAVTPFRYLATSDDILLLTPYLHLPPPGHPTGVQMDPFQPFGKILCNNHSNIKHMPYVAKHGMLDSHERMVLESSAVLVIVADSSASSTYLGERLDKVDHQVDFMLQVEALALSVGKPCLVVEVGLGKGQENTKSARLQVVNWQDLETAPGVIFAR